MSNNPFLPDVDAATADNTRRYRFEFPNGHIATVTSTNGGPWCVEVVRPIPAPGQHDLDEWRDLHRVADVAGILADLLAEPAGQLQAT